MSGECDSPAQEGSRRWGRHLRSGLSTAAKATFALTHRSNPREVSAVTESRAIAQTAATPASVASALGGGDRRGVKTVPSRRSA
jgi:hypothetical protein